VSENEGWKELVDIHEREGIIRGEGDWEVPNVKMRKVKNEFMGIH